MIRNLPIDLGRLPLLAATAEPIPVAVWAELSDGSRRPVPGKQGTTEDGVPLWQIDRLVAGVGGDRAEVVTVQVASHDAPKIAQFQPVNFQNLTARVSKTRGGDIRLYWQADGINGGQPVRKDG